MYNKLPLEHFYPKRSNRKLDFVNICTNSHGIDGCSGRKCSYIMNESGIEKAGED